MKDSGELGIATDIQSNPNRQVGDRGKVEIWIIPAFLGSLEERQNLVKLINW